MESHPFSEERDGGNLRREGDVYGMQAMSGPAMKAAVRREYGPPGVLRIEEIPRPDPAGDEVLIRVHAASVNLGDWELLTAEPLYCAVLATLFTRKPRHAVDSPGARKGGFFKPKFQILGSDFAGRVEAVGGNVTQFRPGDEVFGDCGISGFGAFAEYVPNGSRWRRSRPACRSNRRRPSRRRRSSRSRRSATRRAP